MEQATPSVVPLPSGRHRLTREFVTQSQRDRILDAMAFASAEDGYGSVRIADVVRRARVSRTTFYQQFRDKQECFLAAYDAMLTKFLGEVVPACVREDLSWPEQTEAGLEAMLAFMSREPAYARMCMIEVIAAGPAAMERYMSAVRLIASFVDRGRAEVSDPEELPPRLASALVGGGALVIRDEILAGRVEELPRLLPRLLYTTLVPYLGRREALRRSQAAGSDSAPVAQIAE